MAVPAEGPPETAPEAEQFITVPVPVPPTLTDFEIPPPAATVLNESPAAVPDVLYRYSTAILAGVSFLVVVLGALLAAVLQLNRKLKFALESAQVLERDLRRTAESLEARVGERTGELMLRTDVLDRINRAMPLEDILVALARQVESRHHSTVCVILLLEPAGSYKSYGTIRKLPDCYLKLAQDFDTDGNGTPVGKRVVVHDVTQLPWWRPFRSETRRTGLRACWVQPVLDHGGAAIGSVVLFHRNPKRPPGGAEAAQLEDYARLVSLAVDHERTGEELRIAATAFESQDGIFVTDVNRVIIRVNKAACEISGYSREEMLGQTPRMFRSDRHDEAFYREMYQALESQGFWRGEVWNKRKNGVVYPQWQTITAVTAHDGKVTNYVSAFTDITAYKMAEDQIRHLAFYDSLTRLPNRRLLIDRLEKALVATARTKRHGALMFLDLDNFKTLNDTYSHELGDLLLVEVGRRLQECVRAKDTVARLGGDEFLVMMEELDGNSDHAAVQAAAVAEKIRAALAKPYRLESKQESSLGGVVEHQCTSSIGVTLFNDQEGTSGEYLKRADLAMYQAKAAGRNAIRFFDPAMQLALANRSALADDLRQAIALGQLRLLYQVQVDAAGQPIGAEALIRWDHPQRGSIPPSEFMPLAEETGLILGLSEWVLKTACDRLAEWAYRSDTRHLQLAINISARQFRQSDFVNTVRTIIAEAGVEGSRLKLEITERIVLEDIDEAITKMGLLKAIGVGFAMDDFGTGYSSLSYLQRLPIDQVKIDSSFIQSLPGHTGHATIVRTIIALCRNLGLGVIAEGVETEAQRAFLVGRGCNCFQGYLFGRPVEEPEFIDSVVSRLTA
jgi:diguanylate cyclase (GGDEF)-like protein/PAS domain S-box-containing protein